MDSKQRRILLERQRNRLESQLRQDLNTIRAMNKVDIGLDKFVAKSDDRATKLASETVGLVHLDQFQRIKESTLSISSSSSAHLDDDDEDEEASRKDKKIKERAAKLSFDFHNDDDDGDGKVSIPKRIKIAADPAALSILKAQVDEVQVAESRWREEQEKKRLAEEEQLKREPFKLSCSFFDGTDRRFMVEARKGDSVLSIIERAQVTFPALKGSLPSGLLLVKENIILPHHLTVWECIARRAAYKHTAIFSFIQDEAGMDVEPSKSCRIVTRSWYDKNRHAFPAKQWMEFDPAKIFPVSVDISVISSV